MKLVHLQILRAFAALLVVIHHAQFEAAILAERIGTDFTPNAWLPWSAGVDIFFVISGFIIVHAARPLYGQPGGRRRFLAHRIARLVPLYWLVTALYLAVAMAVPSLLSGLGGRDALEPGYVVASFLFWPMLRADGIPQPLYSLGWTLNCEMFFYAVFAVGLGWGRGAAFAWLTACLSALVALALLVPGTPMPLRFWGSPVVLEFALGAALGLAHAEGLRISALPRLGFAVAGLAMLSVAGEADMLARPLAYGGPAVLLVAAAALGEPGRSDRASRLVLWCVALGDASYALYLTHPFVLRAAREAVLRLGLAPAFGGGGTVALMLVLAMAAALVIHRLVERPLTRRARALLDPEDGRSRRARKTL